jgi:hypothetical protein
MCVLATTVSMLKFSNVKILRSNAQIEMVIETELTTL